MEKDAKGALPGFAPESLLKRKWHKHIWSIICSNYFTQICNYLHTRPSTWVKSNTLPEGRSPWSGPCWPDHVLQGVDGFAHRGNVLPPAPAPASRWAFWRFDATVHEQCLTDCDHDVKTECEWHSGWDSTLYQLIGLRGKQNRKIP